MLHKDKFKGERPNKGHLSYKLFVPSGSQGEQFVTHSTQDEVIMFFFSIQRLDVRKGIILGKHFRETLMRPEGPNLAFPAWFGNF